VMRRRPYLSPLLASGLRTGLHVQRAAGVTLKYEKTNVRHINSN
jgi:hypothetical protein